MLIQLIKPGVNRTATKAEADEMMMMMMKHSL